MSFWRRHNPDEDDKDQTDSGNEKMGKWYIGKYVGRAPPRDNSRTSDDSESHNRNSSDEHENDSVGSSGEDGKNEKIFVRVVRSIRNKFMSRRLIGNIYVYRAMGFVSTAMQCQIGETDYFSVPIGSLHSIDALDEAGAGYKRAITMTDTILDSLERRAMSWDGVDFNGEVTLSRGAKFALNGPFIGIVGYTLSLEISATVQSLIDSRKHFLANRKPSMSFSSLARSVSFSFYGNKTSKEDTTSNSTNAPNANLVDGNATASTASDPAISTSDDNSSEQTKGGDDAIGKTEDKPPNHPSPKKAPPQHIMV
mmetsp:Transcript_15159/g.16434  ORF Transcript_15159/g.16434 Transcript_15159/m.16434 type:complete len:310 (-) Transcript_15159:254-1183(-)